MQVKESKSSKQNESKRFISMMNSLTWHLRQDVRNQEKIFECLNSVQQKRLFQSMKDEDEELRVTVTVFILYLLYKNDKLFGLILKRDGIEMNPSSKKYIIGGLRSYNLSKTQMIEILKIINSIEEVNDVICWSINIKTKKVQHVYFEQIKGEKVPNLFLYDKQIIDPKNNIIGIFTSSGNNLTQSKISIKNLSSQTSSKGSYSQKYKTTRF